METLLPQVVLLLAAGGAVGDAAQKRGSRETIKITHNRCIAVVLDERIRLMTMKKTLIASAVMASIFIAPAAFALRVPGRRACHHE